MATRPDFAVGSLRVVPSLRTVTCEDRSITLEPRVMQVLIVLHEAGDKVVSRATLAERCWNGVLVGDDALNRCIAKLRRLGEETGAFGVETVPRVGYRLRLTPSATAGDDWRRSGRRAFGWPAPAVLALAVGLGALTLAGLAARTRGAAPAPLPVAPGSGGAPALGPGVFRDCAQDCPEMVVLPRGAYVMGAADRGPKANEPQRPVRIAYDLAISRRPITRAQYRRFLLETDRRETGGCFVFTDAGQVHEGEGSAMQPGFTQGDDHPAVCVSWGDAMDFVDWLSARTGKTYVLPSEAEWEYAARAPGRKSVAPSSACRRLNAADRSYAEAHPADSAVERGCADGFAYTSPSGRFPANGFGLFDLLGNVAQWTADCYQVGGARASDGSAWQSPHCSLRVAKGGGWVDHPSSITASRRLGGSPGDRYPTNGFRVARRLP